MAWRRPGDKRLSEPIMVSLLTHICVTRPQWINVASHWLDAYIKWSMHSYGNGSSTEDCILMFFNLTVRIKYNLTFILEQKPYHWRKRYYYYLLLGAGVISESRGQKVIQSFSLVRMVDNVRKPILAACGRRHFQTHTPLRKLLCCDSLSVGVCLSGPNENKSTLFQATT